MDLIYVLRVAKAKMILQDSGEVFYAISMSRLEITLIGPNPNEMQGGEVRTRTLLDTMGLLGARINRIYYFFYRTRFRISRTVLEDSSL